MKRNENVLSEITDFFAKKYDESGLDFVYLEIDQFNPQSVFVTYLKNNSEQNCPDGYCVDFDYDETNNFYYLTNLYELITEEYPLSSQASTTVKIPRNYRCDWNELIQMFGGGEMNA